MTVYTNNTFRLHASKGDVGASITSALTTMVFISPICLLELLVLLGEVTMEIYYTLDLNQLNAKSSSVQN